MAAAKRSTVERGYGADHKRERQRWAPTIATGTVACTRCGQLIPPGAPWDLDHTTDRTAYLGPAHARCNRRAGGRQGNAAMRANKRRSNLTWTLRT